MYKVQWAMLGGIRREKKEEGASGYDGDRKEQRGGQRGHIKTEKAE